MHGLAALQCPVPCLQKNAGGVSGARRKQHGCHGRNYVQKLVAKCNGENSKAAASFFSSTLLSLSIAQSALALTPGADGVVDTIIDRANVIPDIQERRLNASIRDFEDRTGWKIRILTRDAAGGSSAGAGLMGAWAPDLRTVVVDVNPLSPNILDFVAGADVRQLLPRQFFLELQGKYGNMFFVRDEGPAAAAEKSVKALQTCLERDSGCMSVPDLDEELYWITLICSVLGGIVAGYAARLGPQFILYFAPLWGILFGSFGILPVVSRTSDILPLAGNTAAFFAGGALLYFSALFRPENWGGDRFRKDS